MIRTVLNRLTDKRRRRPISAGASSFMKVKASRTACFIKVCYSGCRSHCVCPWRYPSLPKRDAAETLSAGVNRKTESSESTFVVRPLALNAPAAAQGGVSTNELAL